MEQRQQTLAQRIRSFPGMFIGSTDGRGVRTIVDTLINQILAIGGNAVSRVALTVTGPLTMDIHVVGRVQGMELRRFTNEPAGPSSKSDLLSMAVLAALSERLDAHLTQDGVAWSQSFAAGAALGPPCRETVAAADGLRLRFQLDNSIFRDAAFSFLALCGRMQEMALFHPSTVFRMEQTAAATCRRDYHYPAGLLSYLEELEHDWFGGLHCGQTWSLDLADGADRAHAVIYHRGVGRRVFKSFVNGRRTAGGGSHVEAFELAFSQVWASAAGSPFRLASEAEQDPLAEFTVLLAVDLEDPHWAGSTKDKLEDNHAGDLVTRMVASQLPQLWKQALSP